jgi:hypothetical protein
MTGIEPSGLLQTRKYPVVSLEKSSMVANKMVKRTAPLTSYPTWSKAAVSA